MLIDCLILLSALPLPSSLWLTCSQNCLSVYNCLIFSEGLMRWLEVLWEPRVRCHHTHLDFLLWCNCIIWQDFPHSFQAHWWFIAPQLLLLLLWVSCWLSRGKDWGGQRTWRDVGGRGGGAGTGEGNKLFVLLAHAVFLPACCRVISETKVGIDLRHSWLE